MGTSHEWVTCNKEVPKLVEIPHNGYIIDLISSLKVKLLWLLCDLYITDHTPISLTNKNMFKQAMLSNPAVKREVANSHYSSDGYIQDFCDGSYIKNHVTFQTHPQALQIIIYYVDIEVGNPLGSKSGIHKLGIMYTLCVKHLIYIYATYRVLLLHTWQHPTNL